MSLMFFLSGLFVPSSLARKGSWKFLSDRLLRIGLPMALAIMFLSPLAYYAAYRTTAVDPSPDAFWNTGSRCRSGRADRNGSWASCWRSTSARPRPASFRSRGGMRPLVRLVTLADGNPVRFVVGLATISAPVYVPLMLAYSPFAWVNIGPISFQSSRPLHYLVYFLAGVAVGTYGLDRGLLDCDGVLARRWPAWLAAAFAGFLLWAAPTSVTLADWSSAPLIAKFAAGAGSRLRDELPLLAGDLLALCALARVGVRQSFDQCLPHVSYPLCVCRLAAIRAAGHRLVCSRQSRDRVRRDPDHELVDRRRDGRRAAGLATERDDTGSARRMKSELTLHKR